jgi:acetyltransferase
MSIYHLEKIFHPSSIAVVGASDKKGSVGCAVLANLVGGGFAGPIFPVNVRQSRVMERMAYSSLLQIGQPVDLAIIATPLTAAPQIIRDCAQAGVAGAIIASAGGKEIGPQGQMIEEQIRREAANGLVRIIGPNCLGIICGGSHLNASFASHAALPGNLAFVSQSGAICTAILDLSLKQKIGFSHFVSIGSMLDVDYGDLINYLGNDEAVRSIVLYVESLTNIRKFMSAARAVARIRPIVVLKSGRCAAGARAAASHTGALAGEDAVYDAAFKRAGIVRVDTLEELFDCAELMSRQPRPSGPGVAIITNAGGPGVMAADALAAQGLEPALLNSAILGQLDASLPPFWSHGNPIDILGDASPERYQKAVEICLGAPEINVLLIILTPQAMTDPSAVATTLSHLLRGAVRSVFTVWMGGVDVEPGRAIFHEAGIPTYETPERAIAAFIRLYSYKRNLELLQEVPPQWPQALQFDQGRARTLIRDALQSARPVLAEKDSKELLNAYGIPVNCTELAGSLEQAVQVAQGMGYPLVMKVHSPDISHKSDAHGVQLNLRHAEDIREAFGRIMAGAKAYNPQARVLGVTLQPMLPRSDYELIVGSKRDPFFGPVILFGMGGIMTEILRDQALALCPLNRLLARRLMENTRVFQLLTGYRNRPPANLEKLEEILLRLSQLVTDFPEIVELDINPLILTGEQVCAVDARVVVQASAVPSPMHLVISPYPNQYEVRTTTKDGAPLLVRPIKPEDAPLLVELFQTLSPRSVFFRFFSPLKTLPPEVLARFTQIDYDRDMALVAIEPTETGEGCLEWRAS